MVALLVVLYHVLGLFKWVLIITAVLSWLMAFGVINRQNQFVNQVYYFTQQLTEPFLRPIRQRVPPFNGLDLSFLILWFAIMLAQLLIQMYAIPAFRSAGL